MQDPCPALPLAAYERLHIADAGPASVTLDALLAAQDVADRRRGKRLNAGPSSCPQSCGRQPGMSASSTWPPFSPRCSFSCSTLFVGASIIAVLA